MTRGYQFTVELLVNGEEHVDPQGLRDMIHRVVSAEVKRLNTTANQLGLIAKGLVYETKVGEVQFETDYPVDEQAKTE